MLTRALVFEFREADEGLNTTDLNDHSPRFSSGAAPVPLTLFLEPEAGFRTSSAEFTLDALGSCDRMLAFASGMTA